MIRRAAVLLTLSCLTALAAEPARPTGPASPEAVSAQKAFDAAEARAKAEYDKAVKAAKADLVKALEAAKDRATRAGDLDEALRIRDRLRDLQAPPAKTAASAPAVESPVGAWATEDGKTFTLAAGGKALRTGASAPYNEGTWTLSKGQLTIRWYGGSTHVLTGRDGKALVGKTLKDGHEVGPIRLERPAEPAPAAAPQSDVPKPASP